MRIRKCQISHLEKIHQDTHCGWSWRLDWVAPLSYRQFYWGTYRDWRTVRTRRGSYWCTGALLRVRAQGPPSSQDWVRRTRLELQNPSGSHLESESYLDWRRRPGKIFSAEIWDF